MFPRPLKLPPEMVAPAPLKLMTGSLLTLTAAMAGAISGARLGLEAVPSHLAQRLTDQGTWGYAELVALAEKCYDLKMQQLDT